jgi:hypothetical protein
VLLIQLHSLSPRRGKPLRIKRLMSAMQKLAVKPLGDVSARTKTSSWLPSVSGRSTRSTRALQPQTAKRESQYLVGPRAKKKLMVWRMINLVRRLVVIAAAVQYIYISMAATWRTLDALEAKHNPPESFRVFTATLISGYVGKGLVRDSPLVQDVLGGDTTPRDHALFLQSKTNTSTETCDGVKKFTPAIYNYDYLSHAYLEMVADTQYNITALEGLELVLVVVDCSFTNLKSGDKAMVRFFNVVRSRVDPEEVFLVTLSLNVQDYEIRKHNRQGPAVLAMVTLVRDLSVGNVGQFYLMALAVPYTRSFNFEVYDFVRITEDSYLELRSIPRDPHTQPVYHLITSRKRGFFDGEEQSNIRYMYTLLDSNATTALTEWEWLGEAVISDSWAWVHGLHLLFGVQTLFSFAVLCLVTYHNLRSGKVWIGDPFASVSTAALVTRGALVVLSWYLNSFWMLFEFCLMLGGKISKTQIVRVHEELVHADVMVVYLGLVSLLSSLLRERIDPSIAIFLFELIYPHRQSLVTASSVIHEEVVTYSDKVFYMGVPKISAAVAAMSPFRLWTAFQIPGDKSSTFIFATFFPNAILLSIIAGVAMLRKLYRHFYPEQTRTRSTLASGDRSVNEKTALALKGDLTNFELSTGAELQTRFGLISDYNNYVYFKGMKFASADGVYCSGYVIVNGKMLVGIKDLLSIGLIKATGARFTNVYVYEVDGNTVKDTARLVYPDTFAWSDLWRLNVTVLL